MICDGTRHPGGRPDPVGAGVSAGAALWAGTEAGPLLFRPSPA